MFSTIAPMRPADTRASVKMQVDLKDLAKKQNPVLGFYDPLNLAEVCNVSS